MLRGNEPWLIGKNISCEERVRGKERERRRERERERDIEKPR